ncbi:Stp1/IreP family PP2C-type Ser/Thr phosphatase [Sphaerisporangium corydalis]|uniref:Stp1/IreP family PP2C-type Ser/Thr phosphatase n=1 Tax=Sphaerisporangium corydalis TaxID=1441875 RepID=A0ABV9EH16_9ACTN|nr:Stp1/IreP family PP2C-type Ser/Thr phosphatase [Sphaerisporangium corydalis]
MTIALRYAARSDVGLLREGNEDSAYASPRLLAVADGMGGHAHGEVASSVAITALSSLDRDASGGDLLSAIEAAVRDANRKLHEMVGRDPSLKGMGTTLTAMLWSGTRVALVHVGDSRAYLLRNGELYQITHDHTLVQSLVDDGRITQEEAASHPQRSILLRALDGSGEVDPDLSLREAQINDRYLLCSDGLSSVVSAETLHHTLTTVEEPESVVRQLIDLANRGGGPDNITCIVADVVEIEEGQVVAGDAAVVGAAGSNRLRSQPPDTPAGRASTITAPQPVIVDDDLDDRPVGGPAANAVAAPRRVRRRRLWPIAVTALILIVVVVGGGGYFGYKWTQDQYYVGAQGDELVLFRGVDSTIGPIQLNSVAQSTGLSVSSIPEPEREQVRRGIPVANLQAGQTKINDLKAKSGGDQKTTQPTATPTPKPSRSS